MFAKSEIVIILLLFFVSIKVLIKSSRCVLVPSGVHFDELQSNNVFNARFAVKLALFNSSYFFCFSVLMFKCNWRKV